MRPRIIVVVFLLGVGSMVVLGMVTKLAFDSDKGLRDVTKFKSDFLGQFADRGVREVSYRRLPANTGVTLRMVGEPRDLESAGDLHGEIAELFVKGFPQSTGTLQLSFERPPSFGCGAAEPYLVKEVPLREVHARAEARARREELDKKLAARPGLKLLTVEREAERLRLSFECVGERPAAKDRDALLGELARDAARVYRASARTRVEVELLAAPTVPPAPPGSPGGATEVNLAAEVLAKGVYEPSGARTRSLGGGK